MNFPHIVYDILRWFTVLALLGSIAIGFFTSFLFLIRRDAENPWINRFFLLLVISTTLTITNNFLDYIALTDKHKSLSVLPFYMSFALGPLTFFYVKSRLYTHFKPRRNDLKHFILPIVQTVLLTVVSVSSVASKMAFEKYFFSPFYGNFEKGVFVVQYLAYLYFAYRFIGHFKTALGNEYRLKTELIKFPVIKKQILVVGWLKRFIKAAIILFIIHGIFVYTDYFGYRFLDSNLQTKALFSSVYQLSFAACLIWQCINGIFALRRKI